MKAKNMVGEIFGDITILGRDGSLKNGTSTWWCHCMCGNLGTFPVSELRSGRRKDCGCGFKRTFVATKICLRCKKQRPHADFYRSRDGKVLRIFCRECYRVISKDRYHKNPQPYKDRAKAAKDIMRTRVLAAYGDACVCCGEAESMFLALDHKDGGGTKHRRSLGSNGKGTKFYKWVVAQGFPKTLQLLCHNCNWGKHVNGGTCPHEERG